MKILGLISSLFALAVMSWLYYDWLTINGMFPLAAICFVGALTLFATVLFEIAIAFRINASNLKLRMPLVKKDQQELVEELIKNRRRLSWLCFIGCAILELINALGVFGAQMILIQEANKNNKVVASVVVTDNSKTLQGRVDAIEDEAKRIEDKLMLDERSLKIQLRSLYDDERTRLQSPEWQKWLTEKTRIQAGVDRQRETKKPLQAELDKLTLQSVVSTQSENKDQGVIKGTLFEFIANTLGGDPGVWQFVVMSVPALLLGIIGYGGLAIFLYYRPTKREETK